MANGVEVVMNLAGCRAVRNSPEVQAKLLDMAQAIRASACAMDGCEYVADVKAGSSRAHAMVKAVGLDSIISNAKSNTLLKSLDAGRG